MLSRLLRSAPARLRPHPLLSRLLPPLPPTPPASLLFVPPGPPPSVPPRHDMDLRTIVTHLEALAPTCLAEDWDNVGLLVEPSADRLAPIDRLLLTNDLTEEVLDEALGLPGKRVGLIVAYHPPIFRPLKRLSQSSATERILVRSIEAGVAIYSAHTAHDSAVGGVNDWLASGLGQGRLTGIQVGRISAPFSAEVKVHGVGVSVADEFKEAASGCLGGALECSRTPSPGDGGKCDVVIRCSGKGLSRLLPLIQDKLPSSGLSITDCPKVPVLGGGRLLTLTDPAPLPVLVERTKLHLGLSHVRLATPRPLTQGGMASNDPLLVSTVAVCAGSGASVLRGVKADLYVTGEMSHHEVLEAVSRGTAVVLCEHSNTERGYLGQLRGLLGERLGGGVEVTLASTDRDPLSVV